MSVSPVDFLKLVSARQREFRFTKHALIRAEKRSMNLNTCKDEILTKLPAAVLEQESMVKNEREFNVYYEQNGDKFHRYVVALNNVIRVITMMRISKRLQSRWNQWRS